MKKPAVEHRGQDEARRATAQSAKASGDNLDALSKEVLYESAQALDILGRSKMSKGALVKAPRKTSS